MAATPASVAAMAVMTAAAAVAPRSRRRTVFIDDDDTDGTARKVMWRTDGADETLDAGTAPVLAVVAVVDHNDAALRVQLGQAATWGGCEEAAWNVREWWPVNKPYTVVCDLAELTVLPAELFAYGRDCVTHLSVNNNPNLTVLPDAVARFTALTLLNITKCGIAILPKALSACTELECIYADECPLTSISSEVMELPKLQTLWVSKCQLAAPALLDVAEGVRRSMSFRHITIQGNPGSDDADVALAFARALRGNASLVRLSLTGLDNTTTDPPAVGKEVAAALQRNSRGEVPPEPYRLFVEVAQA